MILEKGCNKESGGDPHYSTIREPWWHSMEVSEWEEIVVPGICCCCCTIALPGVAVFVGRVATHPLVILFERIENDSMVAILAIVLTAAAAAPPPPLMKFEYDRCTARPPLSLTHEWSICTFPTD
jgi:hypothetical protein